MLLGKRYLFLFPSKTHKKFPSQLHKIGWFPSQEFRALSNPLIQNDLTKAKKPGQNRFFCASAITLTSRRMPVTTLWEREGVLFFFLFFLFFTRPQSSEFLQPVRIEVLEKVSNSQEKPLSIINFPASSWKHLHFCQPARFLWGTDNARNRFVGCPCMRHLSAFRSHDFQ